MNSLTATAPTALPHPGKAADRPIISVRTKGRRLPWAKILAGAAALVATGVGLGSYLRYVSSFESTDDSFLAGDVHPVSARINGTVARVLIDDNAHVEAGQPLVEIDPADLQLAVQGSEGDLAEAQANEAQQEAQIARAGADLEAAAARVAQNKAELELAELNYHRMDALSHNGAASSQSFDEARAAFDAAQATQRSLLSAEDAGRAGLASARAQRAAAEAQVEKAQAAVAIAKLQVDYTVIRAPSSGRVAKKTAEIGERVQPGLPLMAIVSDRVWVVANFKEGQVARLRAGERARIRIDAVSGHTFEGVVESFSPGTGAEFSLLPPDNATGNFTKIVQRVPVKIVFGDASLGPVADRLYPGLSANVKVSVRD
ncbi:MAG TPA: HlyD family secretion protein [Opitutaceae bacterium]|jgi:membrane fusion protein (multidrug efflux system)